MNKFTPITPEQIERFFESRCTPEEAERVADWLRENPELLKSYIDRDWKEADQAESLPEGYSASMLREIKKQIREKGSMVPVTGNGGMVRKKGMVRKVMIGVAAAVLLAVVGTALLWSPEKAVEKAIVSKAPVAAVAVSAEKVRSNKTDQKEMIRLSDSSTVVLYANSTIRYREPFDKDQRLVSLEGKAVFTIATDKTKPFIVTAGAIRTTVLGTEFSVAEERGAITVKLYSGKVQLHADEHSRHPWKADIILTPGEQMEYAATGEETVVSRFDKPVDKADTASAVDRAPVEEQEIVFEDEPLTQVLDKLASCYHLTIAYNKKQLSNRYFTGTVLTSDPITVPLQVIANMNELNIVPVKSGFIIRKPIP